MQARGAISATYQIPETHPAPVLKQRKGDRECGTKFPEKFAVFAPFYYKGKQYKAMAGDRVMMNLLYNHETSVPYDIGETVRFTDVLLVGDRQRTLIGIPTIPYCTVVAEVEEIVQTKVIIVSRFYWRMGRRHRNVDEWVTIVKIVDIEADLSEECVETHNIKPKDMRNKKIELFHSPIPDWMEPLLDKEDPAFKKYYKRPEIEDNKVVYYSSLGPSPVEKHIGPDGRDLLDALGPTGPSIDEDEPTKTFQHRNGHERVETIHTVDEEYSDDEFEDHEIKKTWDDFHDDQ